MADVAALGLAIDARGFIQGVDSATSATDRLGASEIRLQQSTKALQDAMSRAQADIQQANRDFHNGAISLADYSTALQHARREMSQLNQVRETERTLSTSSVATSTAVRTASDAHRISTGRLNQELMTMTRTVLGMNPALGQLGYMLGQMALSGGVMAGALLGVSALASAWKGAADQVTRVNEELAKMPMDKLEALSKYGMRGGGSESMQGLPMGSGLAGDLNQLGTWGRDGAAGLRDAQLETYILDERLKSLKQTLTEIHLPSSEEVLLNASISRVMGSADLATIAGTRNVARQSATSTDIDALFAGRDYHRADTTGLFGGQILRLPPEQLMRMSAITGRHPPGQSWFSQHSSQLAAGGGLALGLLQGTSLGDSAFGAGISGAFSGAMSGAALGPAGAIVGGVAGMVKSLFDHAKAAKEAAEQLKEAQRVFDLSIQARRAAAAGNTSLAEELQMQARFEKEISEARKAGMSSDSIGALKSVQGLEAVAAARAREESEIRKTQQALEDRIRAEQDAQNAIVAAELALSDRLRSNAEIVGDLWYQHLRNIGQGGAADQGSLASRFGRLQNQLNANGASDADMAIWRMVYLEEEAKLQRDTQIRAAQDQLRVVEDQLRVQERMVEETRRVVTSLTEYGRGLLTGSFSTLSPFGQLTEARSQFGMLRSLAMGGDLTAAQSLTGAGNTLLSASRGYNASGAGYVGDFKLVQDAIEAVRGKYANQLTVEERAYNELRRQTDILLASLAALQNIAITTTGTTGSGGGPLVPGSPEWLAYYSDDPNNWPVGTSYTNDPYRNNPGQNALPQGNGTMVPGSPEWIAYYSDDPNNWPAAMADAMREGFNVLASAINENTAATREGASQTKSALEGAGL